jgi:hypothetical protein
VASANLIENENGQRIKENIKWHQRLLIMWRNSWLSVMKYSISIISSSEMSVMKYRKRENKSAAIMAKQAYQLESIWRGEPVMAA